MGVDKLNRNGTLSYIIPSTFLQNEYLKKIRQYLITRFHIIQIVSFANKVFESVTDSIILNVGKRHNGKLKTSAVRKNDLDFSILDDLTTYYTDSWNNKENDYVINLKTNVNEDIVLDKIDSNSKRIDDYLEVYVGVVANGIKKFLSHEKVNSNYKKYIQGKHIDKYVIYPAKLFINFDKEKLHSNTDETVYLQKEKILVRKTGNKLIAVIDTEKYYTDQSIYNLYLKKGKIANLKVITSLLNSHLMDFYFNKKMITNPDVFPYIKGIHLKRLPIKFPSNKYNESIFEQCVTFIQFLKRNEDLKSVLFERLIDAMVYELYFPDAMRLVGCEVLKHLSNLAELNEDGSNERTLKIIEKIHKELSDPKHPVNVAMFKMDTVEEIRIIEGKN
jgi:hypothetical protein